MTNSEKPFRVLLFGMYGAVNVGDELICRSVVQGLRRHFSSVLPVVATASSARTNSFNKIEGVKYIEGGRFHYKFWLNIFIYLAELINSDAIVIGGGGLFQDHYSWRLPLSGSFCALTGKMLGKPVLVIGIGAGPLNRPVVRQSVVVGLDNADLVCTRDQQSKDVLVDCGVTADRIVVTADVVPSMLLALKNDEYFPVKRIAFVLREWPGIDKVSLALLFNSLVRRNYKVSLICFEPLADEAFYNSVVTECDPNMLGHIAILKPSSLDEALVTIEQAKCVVSMRYHGVILALKYGKPVVLVEYEKKVANLAQNLGLNDLLKQTGDLRSELLVDIERVISCWKVREISLKKKWSEVISASEMNFSQLKVKLKNHRSNKVKTKKIRIFFIPWSKILFYALREEFKHIFLKIHDVLLRKIEGLKKPS